jgi:hypothetical protein
MQIPVIKLLIETYSKEELVKAEEMLAEELQPEINIEGEDEGEKLTHVFAAIWILDAMENEGMEFKKALRAFTQKVRSSIN